MAIGQTIGSIGGFALGGPTGSAIGGAAGSLFDAAQNDAQAPPATDPQQLEFLNELQQKKRSINTGTEFDNQEKEAQQGLAQTQQNIANAAGGDVGDTIAGFNKAQRVYGNNLDDILAKGAQNEKFFSTMAGDMLNRISDRKYQLQIADYNQKLAQSKQSEQDAGGVINAAGAKSGYGGLMKHLWDNAARQTNSSGGRTGGIDAGTWNSMTPGVDAGDGVGDLSQIAGMA